MAQLVLALQGAGFVGELVHQLRREILDIHPTAALRVAEEGEHAVALGQPPVLGDDFRRRFGRQPAFPILPQQPPDEAGIERGDAHRVVEARANVADAHLHRRVGVGRADVPPQLAAVLDRLHASIVGHQPVVLGPRPQRAGKAGARQRADDVRPVRLEPGLAPGVEGRRARQGEQQRKISPRRGHDPDARIRVAETGMNVHTADEEPPHALLQRDRRTLVTLLGGDRLHPPCREGVSGGGHHRDPVFLRRLDHQPARLAQRRAQPGDRAANLGIGLDLRTQEFRHHLVRPALPFAFLENAGIGLGQDVAGLRIDEEELLFDAERDGEIAVFAGHDSLP